MPFSSEALGVFEDEFAITILDENDAGEQRFASIGMGTKARILVVIYTYRGENIRLISAERLSRTSVKNTRHNNEKLL